MRRLFGLAAFCISSSNLSRANSRLRAWLRVSSTRINTSGDHLCGINQQTRRNAYLQTVSFQVSNFLAYFDQIARRRLINAAFVSDAPHLGLGRRIVEFE